MITMIMRPTFLLKHGKKFAVLIDPDKQDEAGLERITHKADAAGVDLILVGGSLLFSRIDETVARIKRNTSIPVWLFPGNTMQICPEADGILLLSMISGRKPELLIGNHVIAAPAIKQSGLAVVSVGYMLIDGGRRSSVEYMSNTIPIPADKNDIAVATAMAGEMLGMQMIYLEAGSGAKNPVPQSMISAVQRAVDVPVVVGGGLRYKEYIADAFNAGATWVVLGNGLEDNPDMLNDLPFLPKT